jgi:RNA polymerase sigma factor (TIGR02999 family)
MSDATRLIEAANQGDLKAADELLPLVYDELRKLAESRMARESLNQTLQPTALVHEAWLRLAGSDTSVSFANRAHFFAAAAQAMRRILIDRARRKSTGKRGNRCTHVELDKLEIAIEADDDLLLLVNESLDKLEKEDSKAAELVKLRFFGGLTLEEAGTALGFSERTAKRYWSFAKAWLYDDMRQAIGG